ncbi:ABC transporter permease [Arthrobacter sp. MYb214]|uniref:ABC transporter permease n=1 Tax=Micrococcaceae TaxID=1268 RepID=UPI000CFD1B7E|nr:MULTISPECIES: ABC transporter permease [unclassified Arthrobacter]PQZ89663.1 ABC transporter permease [Arthrobacter sp. MYb222]PRB75292.1 ABC transporter permease [Arthrobacter sp. MYb214]
MSATLVPVDEAPAPGASRTKPRLAAWIGYAGITAVLLLFAFGSPFFLTASNIATILTQASVFGIAGVGLAIVIIAGGDDVLNGGIDLSTGAVAGLAGTVTALAAAAGTPGMVAVLYGVLVATAIGVVNGLSVTLGLRPLLATLATMGVAASLELVFSQNLKIAVTGGFFEAARGSVLFGIPLVAWLMALIGAAVWWVYGKTSWGVNSYAVGQNPTAAQVAGLDPRRYRLASYVLSSALAGLAGTLLVARLSAAVPGIGTQILLDIILVAYMSMIFSRRRLVSVVGTVLAAVFVAALDNGLTLLGVASQWVGAAKGLLILLVLASVTLRGRKNR